MPDACSETAAVSPETAAERDAATSARAAADTFHAHGGEPPGRRLAVRGTMAAKSYASADESAKAAAVLKAQLAATAAVSAATSAAEEETSDIGGSYTSPPHKVYVFQP